MHLFNNSIIGRVSYFDWLHGSGYVRSEEKYIFFDKRPQNSGMFVSSFLHVLTLQST